MWSEARHQQILSLLQRDQRLTTEAAVKALGVSRETIRRDFLELEALGFLQRVHGGAIHLSDEPPLDKRQTIHVGAKTAIARTVAQALRPPVTVFMDAGSTTSVLARELVKLRGLTIITNSLNAATCFSQTQPDSDNQVIVLPGKLNPLLFSTSGVSTVLQIQTFHADIALLSPVGVSLHQGATSFLHDEAVIARAMSQAARETWILADHSKIGVSSRETFCRTPDIHRLFCDQAAENNETLAALRAQVGALTLC